MNTGKVMSMLVMLIVHFVLRFGKTSSEMHCLTKVKLSTMALHIAENMNLLVIFTRDCKKRDCQHLLEDASAAAAEAEDHATLLCVNCGTTSNQQICSHFGVTSEPITMKHFHNGNFNTDVADFRSAVAIFSALSRPFSNETDEFLNSNHIRHVTSTNAFEELLESSSGIVVVFCYEYDSSASNALKKLFVKVARERRNYEFTFVAINLSIKSNGRILQMLHIQSTPQFLCLQKSYGQIMPTEYSFDAMLAWLDGIYNDFWQEPIPRQTDKLLAIDASQLAEILNGKQALILFHVPDCQPCQPYKMAFSRASQMANLLGIEATFATVDMETWDGSRMLSNIRTVPTIGFYKNEKLKIDLSVKTENELLSFVANPTAYFDHLQYVQSLDSAEWTNNIVQLEANSFSTELKSKPHAMVLFYRTIANLRYVQTEFNEAARYFANDTRTTFAIFRCTELEPICRGRKREPDPTIYYYSFSKPALRYSLGNTKFEMIGFLKALMTGNDQRPNSLTNWRYFVHGVFGSLMLTPASFLSAVYGMDKLVVFFLPPDCLPCQRQWDAFNQLAVTFDPNHLTLSYVECIVYYKFCARYGMTNSTLIKYYAEADPERTFRDWTSFKIWIQSLQPVSTHR